MCGRINDVVEIKDTSSAVEDQAARKAVLAAKGWLTEYQLRHGAELAGYPTTHAQLMRLHGWDLLGQPDTGRWPPEAMERLIEARKAESEGARFLPRRVVRLRADFQRFPIPSATLRRAMVEMIDVIKRPAHNLSVVHRTMCWLVEYQYAQYGPPAVGRFSDLMNEQRYPPAFPHAARLPAPSTWKAILQDPTVPDGVLKGLSFGGCAWEQYRWDGYLQALAKRHKIETAYRRIPPEERIVLLTIRHLGLSKQTQENTASSRDEQLEGLRRELAEL